MNGLHTMRETRGLTLKQVGTALQVSTNTVWMWESGRAMPSRRNIVKLCEYFSCTIKELF